MDTKSSYTLSKIEEIQRELEELKKIFLAEKPSKRVNLEGILKGIKITEEDITGAKRSLFKNAGGR